MKNEIKEYFEKHGYVTIKNFMSKEISLLCYQYSKIKVQSMDIKYFYNKEKFDSEWDGNFGDPQVPSAYGSYGDSLMESILYLSTDAISNYLQLKLFPTYSYWRFYEKNDSLKRHKDRESCEISATLCLGFDTSNLDYDYSWPMFVESKTGEIHDGHLEPGDLILYKGCEVDHWREPFKGLNHAQVFLHYNDLNGPYKNLYDERNCLGVPKKFVKGEY